MTKMAKQLFVAAVALAAFTACSDSSISELNPGTNPLDELPMNSAVLTNASGQEVASLSPDFGTYYLDIKTDGIWRIVTPDNMEFTPTKMFGRGNARVPVLIGNNWAESRQLYYNVKFLDENGQPIIDHATRADGDGTQVVTQETKTSLEKFTEIINSNTFVGYGFNPSKNALPELCAGCMIFDMDALIKDPKYVKNSLVPTSKQHYFYAHADTILDKVIAVNGHIGGNFNVVKLGLNLNNLKIASDRNFESTSIQKSITRTVYSRELELGSNILADETKLTPGFKTFKERFVKEFNAATTAEAKKKAAKDFFLFVGSHIVTKAFLGSELDYRMTFSSDKVKNVLDVKAALDFKWQQQVKDTAKVDSTLQQQLKQQQDSAKNFFVKGDVQYSDSSFKAATSTTADVKARGGDVEKVNILTTGGSLQNTQLAEWMLATEPEKATMTYMEVLPIYELFMKDDEKAIHDFLKDLIDKDYNMEPVAGDYGKLE